MMLEVDSMLVAAYSPDLNPTCRLPGCAIKKDIADYKDFTS